MKKKSAVPGIRAIYESYGEIYKELFSLAYCITGNDRTAEAALASAMLMNTDSGDDFVRTAFENTKNAAIEAAVKSPAYENYTCFLSDHPDLLYEYLSGCEDLHKRIVMMKYGAELSVREISMVLKHPQSEIKKMLLRIRSEAAGYARDRRKIAPALRNLCRKELQESSDAPDYNSLIRAAEFLSVSKREKQKKNTPVRRAAAWFTALIAMALLLVLIWMFIVLISYFRDTLQEPPAQAAETIVNYAPEDDYACC